MSTCKVVMLGIGSVGKSAISIQFVQGMFVPDYDPTIDANYKRSATIDNKTVQIEIFDTAGMESFENIMTVMLRSGDVFIILYDITDHSSFDAVESIHENLLRTLCKESIPCIICGNKCDLDSKRDVQVEEGKKLAASLGATFFETSAKTCENVENAFFTAVKLVWESNGSNEKKEKEEKKPWWKCQLI